MRSASTLYLTLYESGGKWVSTCVYICVVRERERARESEREREDRWAIERACLCVRVCGREWQVVCVRERDRGYVCVRSLCL